MKRILITLNGVVVETPGVSVCFGSPPSPLSGPTGMRRGEFLGLRWSDVDFERGHVSVVNQITTYGGERFELSPKTAESARRVALDPATVTSLRYHRRLQKEERLAWGDGWTDTGLVFTREDGVGVDPNWVTRQLPRFAEEAGLPRLTPHGLRHTWATLALKNGTHPKVVADRMAHSSVKTTLDLYSHVVEGLDAQAAVAIAGLIDREESVNGSVHTFGDV